MDVPGVDREDIAFVRSLLEGGVQAEVGIAVGESGRTVQAGMDAGPHAERAELQCPAADHPLVGEAPIGGQAIDVARRGGIRAKAAQGPGGRRAIGPAFDEQGVVDPGIAGRPKAGLGQGAGDQRRGGGRGRKRRACIGKAPG